MMCRYLYFTLAVFFNLLFVRSSLYGQSLRLQIAGDEHVGFHVDLYEGDRLTVRDTGVFSIQLSNLDGSVSVDIPAWKVNQWEGDDQQIILKGRQYIPELDAYLQAQVRYQIINDHIVRKDIDLFQPSMPSMYYILKDRIEPASRPLKYVSFEHDDFPGGWIHELYPAAGFVTPEQRVVGFLTDAGYKNQYTRTTRRRFNGRGHGFVGMRQLPDVALLATATPEEQQQGIHYLQQTFGEVYNLDAGSSQALPLPQPLSSDKAIDIQNGLDFITPMQDQKIYTVSFLCKGNQPLALKFFRVKNGVKTTELEHGIKYMDAFMPNEDGWTSFKASILVPYIGHDSISVHISRSTDTVGNVQIRSLRIEENQPKIEPYNVLSQGQTAQKTRYIFVEPWKNHHDFMLAAQTRLAEGMGFQGSTIEKMLYANLNTLTWITSIRNSDPFNVPNMNYAPDMYNRDSFFSMVSTYNRTLNLKIWEAWGNTQTPEGAIGTIITPYMGSIEAKDNEATIEWLMWALLNKRRFQVELPKDKIQKAIDFVLQTFDEDQDGICFSHFPMSQIDIIDYTPKTDRLAVNQGMFAVALRTIQQLGYDIPEKYIEKAEAGYRAFYDKKRGHLLFDRQYPDIISLTDLEPEFFSFWLFDRPILTDEMVIQHLEHIPSLQPRADAPHPEYGTIAPILIRRTSDRKGFAYLDGNYQPFGAFGQENYSDPNTAGFYYNGGSWLRAEYCAYVTGWKHGWEKAKARMENRLWAEINLNPDWPFSKEFIPTQWSSTDTWWPSTRGLCWNVFILMANEVAGLRTPDMDPDYKKNKTK